MPRGGEGSAVPGPNAPFQFRLKDPGTETVIASCNASGQTADGIKNDFKKRQFTDLGNYRGFLTRQIVAEAKDKLAEGQKEKGNTAEAASAGPKRNPVPVNSLQNRLRGVACDP